jgi:hypothetical protein
MIKGWQTNGNGTYFFDYTYGTMAKGTVSIEGREYTFDFITGILQPDPVQDGWVIIDGNKFWYENGVRQGTEGRGKEIYDPGSDAWYWLDAVDGGKMAVSKDVYQESEAGQWAGDPETGTGKWVRYDENGHMVKGWQTNGNGTYFFDYTYGTMAKGRANIEGVWYVFNEITGVLERNESQCNLPQSSPYYKYEYAYRSQDLSGISGEDMPVYEGVKAYLDYALQFDTPFLQEKAIHDYMLLNCEYDYDNFNNNTIPPDSYGIRGVLVNKMAVCNGYAVTFKMFMEMLGIECEMITSFELNHAWNRVRLDGEWYMVDVTWDDPVPDQQGRTLYTYFNVPTWFFGHEAGDYSQTAEGTRWMGETTYYLDADGAEDRIADILEEEVRQVNKNKMIAFYVNSTAARKASDVLNNWFDISPYYNAFNFKAYHSENSGVIRLIGEYDSYQEYEKEQIGDEIFKVSFEELEGRLFEFVGQNIKEINKEKVFAFSIADSGRTQEDYYNVINKLRNRSYMSQAYSYQIKIFRDRTVIQVRGTFDNYQEFEKDRIGHVVQTVSIGELEERLIQAADQNIRDLNKEKRFTFILDDRSLTYQEVYQAIKDISQKSFAANGYYRNVICYEDIVMVLMRGSYDSYEEFEKMYVGEEVYDVSFEDLADRMLLYIRENVEQVDRKKIAFRISDSHTNEEYYQVYANICSRSIWANAYGYQANCFENFDLIQLYGAYDNYEAFKNSFMGTEITQITFDNGAETIGRHLVRQGTAVNRNAKYAFVIYPEGGRPWVKDDVLDAVSELTNKARYYHPYCDLYYLSPMIYEDAVLISVRTYYDSFQDAKGELIAQQGAVEFIRDRLKSEALKEDDLGYSFYTNFYIGTDHQWTEEEKSDFYRQLNHWKYGSIYYVNFDSQDYGADGEYWKKLRVSIYSSYSDASKRKEFLDTSYEVSQTDTVALLRNVLAQDKNSPHSVYTFWVTREGASWDTTSVNNFGQELQNVAGTSYRVDAYGAYRYYGNVLKVEVMPAN